MKIFRFCFRQTWLIFFLVLGLVLTFPNSGYSFKEVTEIRGVWLTNVDSDVLFKSENINRAINTLSELHFNTLYPTVWNEGYTLYPSQVAKTFIGKSLIPTEELQNRDILQEIVQQGHQKGMAVIPWFEFGFMAPADSDLVKRHPDWLTQRQDGSKIWLEGKILQRVWLNPLHPEVQKFINNLVMELVSQYEIDGIQFDDHFGFPADFGYDDFTLKLYQQEYHGKLPPIPPQNLDPNNNCISNSSDWNQWTLWRSQKITDYMKKLFKNIKIKNPKVLVSLSPNPQKFSLNCYLLDWKKWEVMGLVEELVLQVYRPNLDDFIRELSQPELPATKQHIPVGIGILTGLKNRPVSLEMIKNQIKTTRQQGFAGVSFFFYESLWNLGEESNVKRQSAFKTFFPTSIKRPNLIE